MQERLIIPSGLGMPPDPAGGAGGNSYGGGQLAYLAWPATTTATTPSGGKWMDGWSMLSTFHTFLVCLDDRSMGHPMV